LTETTTTNTVNAVWIHVLHALVRTHPSIYTRLLDNWDLTA